VRTDFAPDLAAIPGSAAELNQVWTELVHNALEAMAGNETLTLRTAVDRHLGDLRLVSGAGETRFQVRLPLTDAPAGQPAAAPGVI
jgi:nitrogen-specific signal transduction histidine kinase